MNTKDIKRILFLVLILLLLGDFIYIHAMINKPSSGMSKKELEEYVNNLPTGGVIVESKEEEEIRLDGIPSDFANMTKYDKLAAGLLPDDNSDSDNDGLTDWDEVNVYGSNPLMISTSGDLYPDSYKVEHNMDLFSYYEYKGDVVSIYNDFPGFVLTNPTTPIGVYCGIKDFKGNAPKDFEVYQYLYVYNLDGTLSFDFSKNEGLKDVTDFDIAVVEVMGRQPQFYKYKVKNGIVDLKKDFTSDTDYYIFIGKCTSLYSRMCAFFHTSVSCDKGYTEMMPALYYHSNSNAIILGSPILSYVGKSFKIYCAIGISDERKDSILNYSKSVFGEECVTDNNKYIKELPRAKLEGNSYLLEEFLSKFLYDSLNDKLPWYQYIFCYSIYNDNIQRESQLANNSKIEFLSDIDELPFKNFASDYANGNCAGISHLTSYLFNNGTIPESGNYSISGFDEVSWYIKEEGNDTLFDRGLSDYKDNMFVSVHSNSKDIVNQNLSLGEEEFLAMIACFRAEGNDVAEIDNHAKRGRITHYDYALVKKMIEYLDNGKILDVYFILDDGSGHSVNVYDYYYDNSDCVCFLVYDSNFPVGTTSELDGFVIKTIKKNGMFGEEYFDYIYEPLWYYPKYGASSFQPMLKKYGMVVLDSDWNVLNDMVDEK